MMEHLNNGLKQENLILYLGSAMSCLFLNRKARLEVRCRMTSALGNWKQVPHTSAVRGLVTRAATSEGCTSAQESALLLIGERAMLVPTGALIKMADSPASSLRRTVATGIVRPAVRLAPELRFLKNQSRRYELIERRKTQYDPDSPSINLHEYTYRHRRQNRTDSGSLPVSPQLYTRPTVYR
jgi:hypothetical protein